MAFLFSNPAPVYTQASFNAFGGPFYEGSGLPPYGDRDLYLYTVAAAKQQQERRQEEYAYAVAQAALAQERQQERQRRQQEYEYAAALAVEERRHQDAVREMAERKSLAWNQKPDKPSHYGYPTPRPVQPRPPHHLPRFTPWHTSPFLSGRAPLCTQGSSFELCAREAVHRAAVHIAKAKAEREARVVEQGKRRRVSFEQARQSALAFLSVLFNDNNTEEKQSKGKERQVPSVWFNMPATRHTPEDAPSQPQAAPVQVEANVAGPSTSQRPNSAPALASPTKSLTAISSIENEFATLRRSFTFPVSLDFTPSSSRKDAPPLVYNSANLPLRVYEQQVTNLLTKLDEVDSEGVRSVRDARKRLVGDIEQVLEEMDKRKEEAWENRVALPKDIELPVEKVVAPANEELEYVEAPAREESTSGPPAPHIDAAVDYDVSPVPVPSPIAIPAVITEESIPSAVAMDASVAML